MTPVSRWRPWWLQLLLQATLVIYILCRSSATITCPSECHCTANSSSQISCINAQLSEIPRSLPHSVTTLDLSGNQIHTLQATVLENFRNLVNLKLKNNKIDTIHDGAFQNLVSLQTLDMSENALTAVHEQTFQGAQKLVHLDLSQNDLRQIDGSLAGMEELSRLELQNNRITRITEFTLRDLSSLRYLILANNNINHIDRRAFRNLPKLMHLVLKGNPIGEVRKFHFDSYYLSYMDLSECGLTKVPRGLPNSIRYLQLRRNNMTTIRRQTFKDCPYVSILVLDENGIEQVEDRTFEHMTYLQQIWLNSNKLDKVPRPLPPSLLRILMDSNRVTEITDVFPSRSQLNTLSFMGNNITRITPDAFQKLRQLDSVDFSNNNIRHIYGGTFSKNSHLKILQLSKNPLQYLHPNCFQGLKNLKTLSLAYILTKVAVHRDSFRDLAKLKKLDLDSSPHLLNTILASSELLTPLSAVEDLSMQSADLSHLAPEFPDYFPNLQVLHLSSTTWHCDTSMQWFRNWLLATPVRIENKDDIRCFTPRSLHNKPLTSLSDFEFAPATPPPSTTTSRWPFTFPTYSAGRTKSPTTTSWEGGGGGSGYNSDSEEDSEEEGSKEWVESNPYEPSDIPKWDLPPLPTDFPEIPPIGRITDPTRSVEYSVGGMDHSRVTVNIKTLHYNTTLRPQPSGDDSDHSSDNSKQVIIIIIATTIATVIIAAILIAIIIYLTRKSRTRSRKEKPCYQNGIKYKHRNDVLYFMPGSGENGGTQETLKTASSKEQMTLVPGRDINHEGPLRIYKWEDF